MNRFFSPVYLAQKSYYYGMGLLKLSGQDVLLASFPKSGNTWVRFFLCNLISLRELEGAEVGFPLLDATMPELGRRELLETWNYNTLPRVVKTHHSNLPGLRRHKHIIVYRDPRDVMISMLHYSRKKQMHRQELSLEQVIADSSKGMEAWFRWHENWMRASAPSLWVAYETLKKHPREEFDRVLDFIGVDICDDVITEAMRRASIDSVRRSEVTQGHSKPQENKEGFTFARSGEAGQWKGVFTEAMLNDLEALKRKYPRAGKLVQ